MDVHSAVGAFFNLNARKLKPGSSILVACSGGPDSVALAWGLRSVFTKRYRFIAGHVNHKLRPGAAEKDAAFVRAFARRLDWPVRVAVRPVGRKGNVEEAARVMRYVALDRMARRTGCAMVLTAHTRDDQAETVLMNLARGAGPDGLAGMAPIRTFPGGIPLGRPLLGVGKAEIMAYLRGERLSFCRDRTNDDCRLTRNWYRRELIPLWAARSPGLTERLATVGRIFRDEASFWSVCVDAAARRCVGTRKKRKTVDYQKFKLEPVALQRRLVRRLVDADLLTFDHVERLRRWMAGPPTDGRFFQLRKGWTVERLSKSKGAPTSTLFTVYRGPVEGPSGSKAAPNAKGK